MTLTTLSSGSYWVQPPSDKKIFSIKTSDLYNTNTDIKNHTEQMLNLLNQVGIYIPLKTVLLSE